MSSASDTTSRRGALALVCSNICSTEGLQGVQGPVGPTGPMGPARPVGSAVAASYYSTTTQTIGDVSPTLLEFPETFTESGITLDDPTTPGSYTAMRVQYDGVYEAWYSVQITRDQGGNDKYVFLWLRINGIAQPNSNGRLNFNSNNGDTLPIVPYILNLSAGDYVEFAVQANDAHFQALAVKSTDVGAVLLGPDIPSVIVGIKQL